MPRRWHAVRLAVKYNSTIINTTYLLLLMSEELAARAHRLDSTRILAGRSTPLASQRHAAAPERRSVPQGAPAARAHPRARDARTRGLPNPGLRAVMRGSRPARRRAAQPGTPAAGCGAQPSLSDLSSRDFTRFITSGGGLVLHSGPSKIDAYSCRRARTRGRAHRRHSPRAQGGQPGDGLARS